MNTDIAKWWCNVHTISGSQSWEPVRARVNARIPKIVRVLARWSQALSYAILSIFVARAMFSACKKFRLSRLGILSLFVSANNMRALNRLQSLLPGFDLALDESKSVKLSISRKVRLMVTVLAICNSRKFLAHAKSPLVDQLMFFLFLASYVFSREIIDTFRVRAVLVANDHSPIPCGFLAAADKQEAALGFVQHAQTTEIFPPLRFDVSFLYGQKSVDIYRKKAPTRNVVLIGSGNRGKPANSAELLEKLRRIKSVGIALTNISPMAGFNELFALIKAELAAERVFVRPHPAYRGNLMKNLPQGIEISDRSIEADAAIADIFVCGNSSVALELLLLGTPVVYSNELDSVEDDYYEFVKSGLIPRFSRTTPQSRTHFVQHYSGDWRRRAIEYDVSFEFSDEEIMSQARKGFEFLLGNT